MKDRRGRKVGPVKKTMASSRVSRILDRLANGDTPSQLCREGEASNTIIYALVKDFPLWSWRHSKDRGEA